MLRKLLVMETTLSSSFMELTTMPTKYQPSDTPFGSADPLVLELPARDIWTDNLIDDIFQAGVDIRDNAAWLKQSVPLVLETIFRPNHHEDSCPRNPIINISKHKAEGIIEEVKVVLGWLINTRSFHVYLTTDKANDWIKDLDSCLKSQTCSKEKLETIIGRLNHTSIIIHLGRYFLTRLQYRLKQYDDKPKAHTIRFMQWDIDDMKLWRYFLTTL